MTIKNYVFKCKLKCLKNWQKKSWLNWHLNPRLWINVPVLFHLSYTDLGWWPSQTVNQSLPGWGCQSLSLPVISNANINCRKLKRVWNWNKSRVIDCMILQKWRWYSENENLGKDFVYVIHQLTTRIIKANNSNY